MPKRKRHYVLCKAGLHVLPPSYTTKKQHNTQELRNQPRRVGDGRYTYVARQCPICLRAKLKIKEKK